MLAIDRNMQWKLAQILEVRYEVPYDEDAIFWDPEESDAANSGEAGDGATKNESQENQAKQGEDPKLNSAAAGHHPESPEDNNNEKVATIPHVRARQPVEYYVNYLEDQRPMDRWVKENMVRINDELVDDLLEDFKVREEEKKRKLAQE